MLPFIRNQIVDDTELQCLVWNFVWPFPGDSQCCMNRPNLTFKALPSPLAGTQVSVLYLLQRGSCNESSDAKPDHCCWLKLVSIRRSVSDRPGSQHGFPEVMHPVPGRRSPEECVRVHRGTLLSLWLPNISSLTWKALSKGPQWKPVTSVASRSGIQFVF